MTILILGLILFIGIHILPMYPDSREQLIDRFGFPVYKVLYSIISLIGFALIVIGFDSTRDLVPIIIFEPPDAFRHVSSLFMLPVFILFAASVTANNIKRITKHPQILAVKLWAFAHLFSNGELASLILFLTFLCWGIAGRISMKRRDLNMHKTGERSASVGIGRDITVIVIGLIVYILFYYYLHEWLIGVPLI